MPQAYFFPSAETPRNAAGEIGAENAEVFSRRKNRRNGKIFRVSREHQSVLRLLRKTL